MAFLFVTTENDCNIVRTACQQSEPSDHHDGCEDEMRSLSLLARRMAAEIRHRTHGQPQSRQAVVRNGLFQLVTHGRSEVDCASMSRFVRGESGGELRRLKRTAWSHQRTFVTPLNDLPRFVGKLLGGIDGLRAATAHIELVVFEPKALQSLVGEAERAVADGDSIRTEGAAGASDLLGACLACWVDFWFVPEPKRW